jgi:branched-chain amino acid transport system ATP-binding protein
LQARQLINKIRDIFNIAVVWIEHIMRALKGIVDRIIVLNYGEKIAEGTFEEITRNKRVIEAYLGEKWVF